MNPLWSPSPERAAATLLARFMQRAGKRSFALNLQTPDGKDVLRRLVEVSDVILENYAPGVMTRLGMAPEVLSRSFAAFRSDSAI